MTDPLAPQSLEEVVARQKLTEALAPLPLASQKRVMEKLRDQYFKPQPTRLTLTAPDGTVMANTTDPAKMLTAMKEVMLPMSQPERDAMMLEMRRQIAAQTVTSAESEIAKARKEIEASEERQAEIVLEMGDLLDRFMTEAGASALAKPDGSSAHKIAEALKLGKVRYWKPVVDFIKTLPAFNPTPFVIEHDWASAFKGAQDFDDGEIRPPFDQTLFEFRIGPTPVCVWAIDDYRFAFLRMGREDWVVLNIIPNPGDADEDMYRMLRQQIRAVCIALDAEVAIKETVRAPERLNRAREKQGKQPLLDYHVIRLNRKERAAPLPRDPLSEPAHHKRLHFVRGHWRHYEEHKTWIRWHLRGDPDLGFIDKHYRL